MAHAPRNDTALIDFPEVASRTFAQNYKDLALATCIQRAYAESPQVERDAGATAAGLESTWTYYDVENGGLAISKLVDQYLRLEYASIRGPTIRLDLLKCFDMYHSRKLDALVKRYVINPNRTYRQDRVMPRYDDRHPTSDK
ncbi:T6SS amidase immunity protein Tai4 family protein [Pandoraea iniqua]|uniref:T6SS amidase immunity protein Tai4 family protein n=1 Tax=Pandoraea iniqua TaxID=2508288 RepID=UPI0015816E41